MGYHILEFFVLSFCVISCLTICRYFSLFEIIVNSAKNGGQTYTGNVLFPLQSKTLSLSLCAHESSTSGVEYQIWPNVYCLLFCECFLCLIVHQLLYLSHMTTWFRKLFKASLRPFFDADLKLYNFSKLRLSVGWHYFHVICLTCLL